MRLIDADALIEQIDAGQLRHPTALCFSELDVISQINQQPTIEERKTEWIPCSERLPENDKSVLATTAWGK